jgi:short-subunit dehydrogenase
MLKPEYVADQIVEAILTNKETLIIPRILIVAMVLKKLVQRLQFTLSY